MCLGRYTGAGFLALSFLFISSCASAFVPVLIAEAVIPKVISRIVANRAAALAANDAVYLTTVSNTNRALSLAALNAAKRLPTSTILKNTANGATWAGIAYSLSGFDIDTLYPPDIKVAKQSQLNENGEHQVDFSGFTIPASYQVNELNPFIVRSNEIPSYYTTINGNRVFGTFEELANQIYKSNIDSYCYPFGTSRCSVSNFSFTNGYYNISSKSGRADFEFDRVLDGKTERKKGSALVWRQEIDSTPDYDQDFSKLLKSLEEAKINIEQLRNMINSLFMQASLSPEYQGVPFSTSNPITSNEILSALPDVKNLTQYEWLKSAQKRENEPVVIKPDTSTDSSIKVEVDLGENPNISDPELETPPTGDEILKPLTELMPDIKNLSLSSKNVQCPVWSFELWGNKYSIDSHCELMEKIRPLLKAVFLLIWGIISLRIILTA